MNTLSEALTLLPFSSSHCNLQNNKSKERVSGRKDAKKSVIRVRTRKRCLLKDVMVLSAAGAMLPLLEVTKSQNAYWCPGM